MAIGGVAALCLVALLLWISLRPTPAGTIVQHPVLLESR